MPTFKIKVKVMEREVCSCGHAHEHPTWKYLQSTSGEHVIFANEEGAQKYIDSYTFAIPSHRDQDIYKIVKE